MPTSSATPSPTHCSGPPEWAISANIIRIPIRDGAGWIAPGCSRRSSDRVEQAGWQTANCDVIIHAQEPKLGPFKPAIRANLARLLGLEEGAVNVKAKTGEHTGPVGRREVIVCEAVVLMTVCQRTKINMNPDMGSEDHS